MFDNDRFERVLPDNGDMEFANEGAFGTVWDGLEVLDFVIEGYDFFDKETESYITIVFVNQINYAGNWGSLTGRFFV